VDTILLHVCCGPCSSVAVPWWRSEGLEPLALFLNPNIQPNTEYARRLDALETRAQSADLELIVAADPRGRCYACLQLRLDEAAWEAARRGLPAFSTSLTISPWQKHDLIAEAGYGAAHEAGVEFLYADLRPHYERSLDESRRLGLYRQPYCGCVPSKWEAWHEGRKRRSRRRDRAA
jgi:predicted adenine nucleotide alpha hydrolase (AANH) superfamily ATPase